MLLEETLSETTEAFFDFGVACSFTSGDGLEIVREQRGPLSCILSTRGTLFFRLALIRNAGIAK